MSIIGIQIMESRDKRLSQLYRFKKLAEDIEKDDLTTQFIVVGHGHKIHKLAKVLLEEIENQIKFVEI